MVSSFLKQSFINLSFAWLLSVADLDASERLAMEYGMRQKELLATFTLEKLRDSVSISDGDSWDC